MGTGSHGWETLLKQALLILLAFTYPGLALAASTSLGSEELRLAYIDPGTGSFLIQALVAAAASVVVATRLYWNKIKGWLGAAGRDSEDDRP